MWCGKIGSGARLETRGPVSFLGIELPNEISSDEDLNKVAAAWILAERRIQQIALRREVAAAMAVVARAASEKKEILDTLADSKKIYEPLMEAYAAEKLKGGKVRTYLAALIEISFTAVKEPQIDVVDDKKALPYIRRFCRDAVVMKPQIMKSKFTAPFKELVARMKPARLLKLGFKVTAPHDRVNFTLRGTSV